MNSILECTKDYHGQLLEAYKMEKAKHIVFAKKDTAELLETDVRELRDNEVKVKTVISTISCGTEKANITGDLNVSIFEGSAKEAVFPRYGGYSSAGIVIEIGDAVKTAPVRCVPMLRIIRIKHGNLMKKCAAKVLTAMTV